MSVKLNASLRFLNLMEPGKNIVSITKTAMWVCILAFAYATVMGLPLDLTNTVAFFSVSSLYAWRRFVQWKTGDVLPKDECPEPSYPTG